MYTLIAENKYGQQLELTDNENYVITSIEGLDPPDATINTSKNANADGSVFNSSYVNDRQIIITMAINYPAEENRITLYQYFKTKMPITLYYENDTRDVYINGYVQNFTVDFFAKKQVAQITIQCPKPLFNDVNENSQTLSQVASLFEFPFEINATPSANLIPYPYDYGTRVYRGITFTDNGDGTITTNGTATAYADYPLQLRTDSVTPFYLPSGTYTISGCPAGGGTSTYRILVGITVNNAWQTIAADSGDGATFEYDTSMGALGVVIAVYQGMTVNNVTFKPILNAGSTALPYTPYVAPGIEFSAIEESNILVVNSGDVETGAIITIHALGTVSNPIIYNVETSEYFGVNVEMAEGDDIIINTIQKEKEVIQISNGVTTNLIGSVKDGSTWLQLVPGSSEFTMTAEGQPDNIYATFTITNLYEGV